MEVEETGPQGCAFRIARETPDAQRRHHGGVGWSIGRRSVVLLLAALAVGLVACATPEGTPLEVCGEDWEPVIAADPRAMTNRPQTIAIECYTVTGTSRLELGFLMPPGPDCFQVELVEVIESDEAVSLELRVGGVADRLGACPPDEIAWSMLVELNGPVGDRQVLDAARRD